MGKERAIVLAAVIMLGVLPAILFSGCEDIRPGFDEIMTNASEAAAEVKTYGFTIEADNTEVDWGVRDLAQTMETGGNFSEIFGMITNLEDIQELDDERIDGVNCYHYIGTNKVDERIRREFPTLEYKRNDTEFWIGKSDFFLRQCKIFKEIVVNDDNTEEFYPFSTATFIFSRFNDPIEVGKNDRLFAVSDCYCRSSQLTVTKEVYSLQIIYLDYFVPIEMRDEDTFCGRMARNDARGRING